MQHILNKVTEGKARKQRGLSVLGAKVKKGVTVGATRFKEGTAKLKEGVAAGATKLMGAVKGKGRSKKDSTSEDED